MPQSLPFNRPICARNSATTYLSKDDGCRARAAPNVNVNHWNDGNPTHRPVDSWTPGDGILQ